MLAAIDQSLLEALSPERIRGDFGPYTALLSRDSDARWCNYAILTDDEPGTDADLDALEAFFRSHGRRPRFEFREARDPQLETRLLARGYELERADPVMVVTPETLVCPTVRLECEGLDRSNAHAFLAAVGSAFGATEVATEVEVERALASPAMRSLVVRVEGVVAGGASLVVGGEVAELAGVGTAPPFQRQGVASVASHRLVETFFAEGGRWVWLSAGSAAAEQVYAGLGFTPCGRQLNFSIAR